jgi:hypothetical protein
MGERGRAMTVSSLRKQPGAIERDGSRGLVRQCWRPQVYQPAARVAEPLLAIETSGFEFRAVLAARRGQRRSRRGGHVGRRVGWILQLRGEILLQIRCRCSEAQSPLQFVIAAGQRPRASRMHRHQRMQPLFSTGHSRGRTRRRGCCRDWTCGRPRNIRLPSANVDKK